MTSRAWLLLGVYGVVMLAAAMGFLRGEQGSTELASQAAPAVEEVLTPQKIMDRRCVACHSCNNAPCQMNLTSLEGLRRGASQARVYNPARLSAETPTRLGVDADSEEAWRNLGFYPVMNFEAPMKGLFLQSLSQKINDHKNMPFQLDPKPVLQSHVCSKDDVSLAEHFASRPHAGMPYNLPPIPPSELQTLYSWVLEGAKTDTAEHPALGPDEIANLKDWQTFLNGTKNEEKLVSRYIYEHLFLAHVQFRQGSNAFHRLVRSATACDSGVKELPTRRPNDDPGAPFFYCFKPLNQTIVEKTHLPYLLSKAKLQWTRENFFGKAWTASSLPSYEERVAANPFVTFEAIPVEARYRFLLEDSMYHVGTFIKGPVCNGSAAVNSIDEQFYVFFYEPSADLMVKDEAFRKAAKDLLNLPAESGSNPSALSLISQVRRYPPIRNKYRKMRQAALKRNFPDGLAPEQLWDGEGRNDNALLTVFRHNETAYVVKGARGDASHTAFVLDYALFERLVYNLAVGFDVYGNLPHQLNTRVYMGMIRMEGENNFLDFLPQSYRKLIRKDWYTWPAFARIEKYLIDETIPDDHGAKMKLSEGLDAAGARAAAYEKFLSERLQQWAKLRPDPINWKSFSYEKVAGGPRPADPIATALSALSSVPSSKGPFVLQFPDVALIAVHEPDGTVSRLFTVARSKYTGAVGSLLFEKQVRQKDKDTLVISEGIAGSYPNYAFVVPREKIAEFTQQVSKVADETQWTALKKAWGLERTRPDFWTWSDAIGKKVMTSMNSAGGVLDYTRYDVWDL